MQFLFVIKYDSVIRPSEFTIHCFNYENGKNYIRRWSFLILFTYKQEYFAIGSRPIFFSVGSQRIVVLKSKRAYELLPQVCVEYDRKNCPKNVGKWPTTSAHQKILISRLWLQSSDFYCREMFKNVHEWRMWPCHCIKASTKSNDQCEKRRDISVWFAHKVHLQYPFVSAFLLCVVRFSEFETPLKIMHCQQSAMCAREMYELTTNHLFCIEYHPTVSHPLYRVDTFQGKFFRMRKRKRLLKPISYDQGQYVILQMHVRFGTEILRLPFAICEQM